MYKQANAPPGLSPRRSILLTGRYMSVCRSHTSAPPDRVARPSSRRETGAPARVALATPKVVTELPLGDIGHFLVGEQVSVYVLRSRAVRLLHSALDALAQRAGEQGRRPGPDPLADALVLVAGADHQGFQRDDIVQQPLVSFFLPHTVIPVGALVGLQQVTSSSLQAAGALPGQAPFVGDAVHDGVDLRCHGGAEGLQPRESGWSGVEGACLADFDFFREAVTVLVDLDGGGYLMWVQVVCRDGSTPIPARTPRCGGPPAPTSS